MLKHKKGADIIDISTAIEDNDSDEHPDEIFGSTVIVRKKHRSFTTAEDVNV